MLFPPNAHQEIVRLYVAMNEAFGVDVFNPLDLQIMQRASTIWSASRRTVLRLSLRFENEKRSSRLGPNKSITITL